MSVTTIDHFVAGGPWGGASDRTAPVYDPAHGVITGHVLLASAADVDEVVALATKAQTAWGEASVSRRMTVLFRFRELLVGRRHELAQILTAEHGKVLEDAAGEIARGIDVVDFALAMPHLSKGEFTQNASTGVDVYSAREPLGVVGIVSPFNFPAMVPMWFFPLAIAAGNAVILKPSEKVPSAANWLAALLEEAGLPAGIMNVVHGDKVAVDALLDHPDIGSISFVGSTPIARYVYQHGTAAGKRVQALGGAKNHMLVLPDADLDLAADAAVNAGFGSVGERCMAVSTLLVVDSVADELVDRIRTRMAALRTGDGRRGCDMGPLITAEHRDRVAGYIDIAAADGATVVVDGRSGEFDGAVEGFWLGPTLIDHMPLDSDAYRDEIFGPVLAVIRISGFAEAIDVINASPYGNGTAIFTNDGGAARRFQREVQVGMIGINVPIPVPVAYYSFGGWKTSMFGDAKAYDTAGFAFFTREKAITSRWLDPSHGGINLGFPQSD